MAEKKPKVWHRAGKFFRDCKSEIKKIVWPTPRSVFKNMGVVLAVIVIIGLESYAKSELKELGYFAQ